MLLGARNDVQGCEGLVEKGVLWPLLEAATEEDGPACVQDTQGAAFIQASTEAEPRQLRGVCACASALPSCVWKPSCCNGAPARSWASASAAGSGRIRGYW